MSEPDMKVTFRQQLREGLVTHRRILAILLGNHELVAIIHQLDLVLAREITATFRVSKKLEKPESGYSQNTPQSFRMAPLQATEIGSNDTCIALPSSVHNREGKTGELSYPETAAQHPKVPQTKILAITEAARLDQARLTRKRKASKPSSQVLPFIKKRNLKWEAGLKTGLMNTTNESCVEEHM